MNPVRQLHFMEVEQKSDGYVKIPEEEAEETEKALTSRRHSVPKRINTLTALV